MGLLATIVLIGVIYLFIKTFAKNTVDVVSGFSDMKKERIQKEEKARQDAIDVSKAQNNWDKCVQEYNLRQHLNTTVSFKFNNVDSYYKKYIWKENKRLYNFTIRPSLANASMLADSIKNYTYYENIVSSYRFIDISGKADLYRRNNYCYLDVGGNNPLVFSINDYDTLKRLISQ